MPASSPSHSRSAEAWATDEALAAATRRYADATPGYKEPAAYALGRIDLDSVELGHVNRPGAVRPLPAVILAHVCGYTRRSCVFPLSLEQVAEAVDRLAPAAAARHIPHPNLWSWRELLSSTHEGSQFFAYFLANESDELQGPGAAEFQRLAAP